jgi:hypothetical protein
MNADEREVLRILVSEVIVDALREASAPHCNLTVEQKSELSHLMGLLRDIGDGDIAAGIEVLRSLVKVAPNSERALNHQYITSWREGTSSVKKCIVRTAVGVVVVGVLGYIWAVLTGKISIPKPLP